MREYSGLQSLVSNLPYLLMVALGTAVLAVGLQISPWPQWTWIAAGAYAAYGVIGALWIMVFVCPYCHHHGTRGCPCGYGVISKHLRSKRDKECFADKFRRHIPAIVPLWIIPPAAGVTLAVMHFSRSVGFTGRPGGAAWLLVGLVAAFALDAFLVLPLTSTRYACKECPQRDGCPWMKK